MIKEQILKEFPNWDAERQLNEYQSYKKLGDFSPFTEADYQLMEMIMHNRNIDFIVECDEGICKIVSPNVASNNQENQENGDLNESSAPKKIETQKISDENLKFILHIIFDFEEDAVDSLSKERIKLEYQLKPIIIRELRKILIKSSKRKDDKETEILLTIENITPSIDIINKIYKNVDNKKLLFNKDFRHLLKIVDIGDDNAYIEIKNIIKYPIFRFLLNSMIEQNFSKAIMYSFSTEENRERAKKIKGLKRIFDYIRKFEKLLSKLEDFKDNSDADLFKIIDKLDKLKENFLTTIRERLGSDVLEYVLPYIDKDKKFNFDINLFLKDNINGPLEISVINKIKKIYEHVEIENKIYSKFLQSEVELITDPTDKLKKYLSTELGPIDDFFNNLNETKLALISQELELNKKIYNFLFTSTKFGFKKNTNKEEVSKLLKEKFEEQFLKLDKLEKLFQETVDISYDTIVARIEIAKKELGNDFEKYITLNYSKSSEGNYERLMQMLFPGSKVSGGSKSYDFYYNSKKYELKKFPKGQPIKLGKEGTMNKFPGLLNIITVLTELFNIYETDETIEAFENIISNPDESRFDEINKLRNILENNKSSRNLLEAFREGEVSSKYIKLLKDKSSEGFFPLLVKLFSKLDLNIDYLDDAYISYKDNVYKTQELERQDDDIIIKISPVDDYYKKKVVNSILKILSIPGIINENYFDNVVDDIETQINTTFANHPMVLFADNDGKLRRSSDSPDGLFRKFKLFYITRRSMAIKPSNEI